jgi:hypothetical protein
MIEIDTRTWNQSCLLLPHEAARKEQRPVLGILEEDMVELPEGARIEKLGRRL